MSSVPDGMAAVGGQQTEQLDSTTTLYRRVWESPTQKFLDPGGQPMGGWLEVQLTRHAASDGTLADALKADPKSPSGFNLGPRSAYHSTWTVTARALDGTTPVQVTATSIYLDLSPTLRLQIDTLGLSPSQAAGAAMGVLVR